MEKLLSVVMPMYNCEETLNRSIKSILENDYTNFELILIDDGSQDSTPELIDKIAADDSRIRVIHQKNSGVAAARNRGIKEAKGEYIAFCDADDWIDCDMYTYLTAILDENPDIVYAECGKRWYYPKTTKILTPANDKKNRLCTVSEALVLFFKNELFHWGPCDMVFRKSCIKNVEFPEVGIAEDMRFHLRVFSENREKLYFSSDDPQTPKYNYNKQVSEHLLGHSFGKANFSHIDFYTEFEQLASELLLDELADKCFAEKCKRLMSYSAKVSKIKMEDYKSYIKKWVCEARKDRKKALKCKNLNIIFKLDYVLFCIFPGLMNKLNIRFLK